MISVENVKYHAGKFKLNVSLEIRSDEYFVLFGSTGCGKTSLLECICGLRDVSEGNILINGNNVTYSDPRTRTIGYMPQDGALFYHMNVRDNIGFCMTVRGADKAAKKRSVDEISEKLRISHLLERRIPGLSGGERQRVSLARALLYNPAAILLDEPVSSLDEFTREVVCRELVSIHNEIKIPFIHVCHSFEEAKTVADRIGVMRDGELIQVDTPDQLVINPRNTYVARLLRLENIFSGKGFKENGQPHIRYKDITLRTSVRDEDVDFMVRPWDISIVQEGEITEGNILEGTVYEHYWMGAYIKLRVDGKLPLVAHIPQCKAGKLDLGIGKKSDFVYLKKPFMFSQVFKLTAEESDSILIEQKESEDINNAGQ